MNPVSIVIPVWNNIIYLPKLFETMRNTVKDLDKYEIVVIDQGSTDGSIEFIEKQAEVRQLIKNTKNTGSTGAWNQGIKATTCQHIFILNSDIEFIYGGGWLEAMVECMKEDVGIVECLEVIWDKSTRWAGAAGFLLNREMVKEIGLFDEKNLWGFCGDTDYWVRATWNKWKMGWCKKIAYWHWCGGTHRRGQLKDSAQKDWDEGGMTLKKKWTVFAIQEGWADAREEAENWLKEERKAGRLA